MDEPKALMVEDDIHIAKIIKRRMPDHLRDRLDLAHSLREAQEKIQKTQYKALLLDYSLPDGTGEDVLRFAHQNGLKVPYIVLSAYSFESIRGKTDESFLSGAAKYVRKDRIGEFIMATEDVLTEIDEEEFSEETIKKIYDKTDRVFNLAKEMKERMREIIEA